MQIMSRASRHQTDKTGATVGRGNADWRPAICDLALRFDPVLSSFPAFDVTGFGAELPTLRSAKARSVAKVFVGSKSMPTSEAPGIEPQKRKNRPHQMGAVRLLCLNWLRGLTTNVSCRWLKSLSRSKRLGASCI